MKLLLLISILFSANVFSEYRVYQYQIKNKVSTIDDPKFHYITSTLDPISYRAYHGGENSIEVDIIRTWICPGHTGRKEICESPWGKLKREVASGQ